MPSVYSTLWATYLSVSLAVVLIVVSAMWDSFVNTPVDITILVDGVQQYAARSTVGLVSTGDPSEAEVLLCAASGRDAHVESVFASIGSFSGKLKLADTRFALHNDLGVVCLTFANPAKLQEFAGVLETVYASARASAEKYDGNASVDLFDSEILDLIASELTVTGDDAGVGVEGGEQDDWHFVDAAVDV